MRSFATGGYGFSIVKWGFIRKSAANLTGASPFPFTPSWELAVFKLPSSQPFLVMHFIDKKSLEFRVAELVKDLTFEKEDPFLVKMGMDIRDSKEGIYS